MNNQYTLYKSKIGGDLLVLIDDNYSIKSYIYGDILDPKSYQEIKGLCLCWNVLKGRNDVYHKSNLIDLTDEPYLKSLIGDHLENAFPLVDYFNKLED